MEVLIDQRKLKQLSEYVTLIESGSLNDFANKLGGDSEFLSSPIYPGHPDGSTNLLMAVLARYREESIGLEWALSIIRRIRCTGSNWGAVRVALIGTIPCSASMSEVDKDRLGALLLAMIMEGLESDGELDEWAGGWLAYYLMGHTLNRFIKDNPEYAEARGLAESDFARSRTYELPVALVLLGSQKDAVPPWTKEQETVRSYAIKSRNPVLWYIVKRACSGYGPGDDQPDRLSEKVEALVGGEDEKAALREVLVTIDSFDDRNTIQKALLFHRLIRLICPAQSSVNLSIDTYIDRLEDAAYLGDVDSIRKLLEIVNNPKDRIDALVLAIAMDHREAFEIIVQSGVDISQTFKLHDEDGNETDRESNALVLASECSLWAVKRLIELGADPSYRDSLGNTALSIAVECEQEDIIQFLKKVSE